MKLRKNSWYYNTYHFLTGAEPNQNFCDFFWETIINILLLPFTWILYLFTGLLAVVDKDTYWKMSIPGNYSAGETLVKYSFKEQWIRNNNINIFVKGFGGLVAQILIYILIFLFITKTTQMFIGLLCIILLILFIIGLFYFFTESSTKRKITNVTIEACDILYKGFKSFKNNYCPKIDWD